MTSYQVRAGLVGAIACGDAGQTRWLVAEHSRMLTARMRTAEVDPAGAAPP